jgi:hypothetical protein
MSVCVHDGVRHHHETYTQQGDRLLEVRCGGCGVLLYSWERKSFEIKSTKYIHDEV